MEGGCESPGSNLVVKIFRNWSDTCYTSYVVSMLVCRVCKRQKKETCTYAVTHRNAFPHTTASNRPEDFLPIVGVTRMVLVYKIFYKFHFFVI